MRTEMTARALPAFEALAPTIFHQPWWLDIVSGGAIDLAEVEMGGRIVGRLPLVLRRRLGVSMATMPPLTHFLGPATVDDEAATGAQLLRRHGIVRALLAKLPRVRHAWIKMHAGVGDTLPFESEGWRTTVQFTALVGPAPEAALWRLMRDKTRNVIRRASERLEVAAVTDLDRFVWTYERNLAARGERNHYGRALPRRLIEAVLSRGQGRLIEAREPDGTSAAAILTVWDSRAEYFLMSTRHARAHAGATSLLLWQVIREASRAGLVFDCDGIRTQNDTLFFTGFTPHVSPRFIVSRSSAAISLVRRFRPALLEG